MQSILVGFNCQLNAAYNHPSGELHLRNHIVRFDLGVSLGIGYRHCNWCRKAQSTVSGAIPHEHGPGLSKEARGAWASEQVNKHCSSMDSAWVPDLTSFSDGLWPTSVNWNKLYLPVSCFWSEYFITDTENRPEREVCIGFKDVQR